MMGRLAYLRHVDDLGQGTVLRSTEPPLMIRSTRGSETARGQTKIYKVIQSFLITISSAARGQERQLFYERRAQIKTSKR